MLDALPMATQRQLEQLTRAFEEEGAESVELPDGRMISARDWPRERVLLERAAGIDARTALVSLLDAHVPGDEKERVDLEEMRTAARDLAEPFSRTQGGAHFTGSAVVVTPDGERVCLVHHGKLHRWLQPGGHAEAADEGSMALSALREAAEETGLDVRLHPSMWRPLDVDVHVIPARKSDAEHRHLDVRYLVVAADPENLRHDPGESHGARWLTWDEALSLADEEPLRRMLRKARARVQAYR